MAAQRTTEVRMSTPKGPAVLCTLVHSFEKLPSQLKLASSYEKDIVGVQNRPSRVVVVSQDGTNNLQPFLDYLAEGNGGAGKAAMAYLDEQRGLRVFLPPQQISSDGKLRLHASWFDQPAQHAQPNNVAVRIDPNLVRNANAQAVLRGAVLDADQEAARRHYDTLRRDRGTRHESYILHLRNLNNFLKASLFHLAAKGQEGGLRVLDLACGKGGDLHKWLQLRPSVFTGVDIAKKSLEDLVQRYKNVQDAGLAIVTLGCCDLGHDRLVSTKFSAGAEISRLQTWTPERDWHEGYPIPPGMRYSIVSMQMALHYAFETPTRARQLLHEISTLLKPGGIFIATTVDARIMTSELLANGKPAGDSRVVEITDTYGRVVCVITADGSTWRRLLLPGHGYNPDGADDDEDNWEDSEAMLIEGSTELEDFMGLRYTFELRDRPTDGAGAAVDAPEWLVPLPALEAVAEEAGLEIVRKKNFSEFFGEVFQDKELRGLMNTMDVLDWRYSITDCTWRLARLYMVLELRKKDVPSEDSSSHDKMLPNKS